MKPQASFSVKQNNSNSVGSIVFKKTGCTVNLKSDKFSVRMKEHTVEDAETVVYDFVGMSPSAESGNQHN
jgi:hypothetical protein